MFLSLRSIKSALKKWVTSLAVLLSFACAPRQSQPKYVCDLPSDQKSSLLNPAQSIPMTLLVDETWSDREVEAIQNAARSWNDSADAALHKTVFSVVTETRLQIKDRSMESYRDCSKRSDIQSTGSVIPVIKMDAATEWKSIDENEELKGITLSCDQGDKNISRAVVLRSMDWVTESETSEAHEALKLQFQSAVTHELGHVLGLNHSCSVDAASDSYISCSKIDIAHPYGQAIMYPRLFVPMTWNDSEDKPQVLQMFSPKTVPNDNDQLRLTCQYPH